jgi:Uma2 family endonuclease
MISRFLENKPCLVYFSPIDVKLKGRGNDKKKLRDEEIKTVVQPDIVVLCDPSKLEDERAIDGSPELIIEILSPGSTKKDKHDKLLLYEENEIREYWIVSPKEKIIWQYILDNERKYSVPIKYKEGDRIQSVVLEGLPADVTTIFNYKKLLPR